MIAYIYETKNGGGYGKIVGEIFVNKFVEISPLNLFNRKKDITEEYLKKACLTDHNFLEYANGKTCYGWIISSSFKYNVPIELYNPPQSWQYDNNYSIILSVHKKWIKKILIGEKTIEIRKSYPKKFKNLLKYE